MGRCTTPDSSPKASAPSTSADFSGHLWRQGNSGRWRLQFFILQGSKLSWFNPTTRPQIPSNKPLGSIQLERAAAEPIAIGCLSDMEGLGRTSMTTADAPAGIPPWGIAVEAPAGGHTSHSAQRLVLAADSQALRDLWLEVIQQEQGPFSGSRTYMASSASTRVQEPEGGAQRGYSASTWQHELTASVSDPGHYHSREQELELEEIPQGPAPPRTSTRPGSDTAPGGQRKQRSGCGQPRLLRCFTAGGSGTRTLVLHNQSLPPSAPGYHATSTSTSRQEGAWSWVSAGPGADQRWMPRSAVPESRDLAAEAAAVGWGAGPDPAACATAGQGTGSAADRSEGIEGEAPFSMPERDARAAGAARGCCSANAASRASSSGQQQAGLSVGSNANLESLSSRHGEGLRGMEAVTGPGMRGWRIRDNASFDSRDCGFPPGELQQDLPPLPLPAFEGKIGEPSPQGAPGLDPISHVESWLSSSLASHQLSSNNGSSSSGLQSAAMAYVNVNGGSSIDSGNSIRRSAGIGSMSSERTKVLLEQYQQLLSSVKSVRQHLQEQDSGVQPEAELPPRAHNTSSSGSGAGSALRVQLGSIQEATGRMREVMSSLQENRQLRREYSRAQSCQQ